MTFLVDTHVISELALPDPDPDVLCWADGVKQIALSVVTVEEIWFGLSWRPKPRVQSWLDDFLDTLQILPVTHEVARRADQLRGLLRAAGHPRTQADMLIAAPAQVHGLTLVTRNARDLDGCSIAILNPFRPA